MNVRDVPVPGDGTPVMLPTAGIMDCTGSSISQRRSYLGVRSFTLASSIAIKAAGLMPYRRKRSRNISEPTDCRARCGRVSISTGRRRQRGVPARRRQARHAGPLLCWLAAADEAWLRSSHGGELLTTFAAVSLKVAAIGFLRSVRNGCWSSCWPSSARAEFLSV